MHPIRNGHLSPSVSSVSTRHAAFLVLGLRSVHHPGSPRDCRKLDGTEQRKFLSRSFIQDGKRCAVEEVVMLRKRKEPRAKKSVLETLIRDMQGIAAENVALFENCWRVCTRACC